MILLETMVVVLILADEKLEKKGRSENGLKKFCKFVKKYVFLIKEEKFTWAIPLPERLKFPGYPYCPTVWASRGFIPGREYL